MMCSNISSDVPLAGEDGEGEANSAMMDKKRLNASKFRGVSWHVTDKKWKSQIQFDGKTRRLGSFAVEEDAAKAFDRAAYEVHGR